MSRPQVLERGAGLGLVEDLQVMSQLGDIDPRIVAGKDEGGGRTQVCTYCLHPHYGVQQHHLCHNHDFRKFHRAAPY